MARGAGKYNKPISFVTETTTQDSFNQAVVTGTSADNVWASINPLNGKELVEAKQINSKINHKFIIRNKAIAANSKIKYDGRTFEIIAFLSPYETGEETHIMASEEL